MSLIIKSVHVVSILLHLRKSVTTHTHRVISHKGILIKLS